MSNSSIIQTPFNKPVTTLNHPLTMNNESTSREPHHHHQQEQPNLPQTTLISKTLREEWKHDWNKQFEKATAKADNMKLIRDKLHNVNMIKTREEELHYKLLGRLGYNRLSVADVVHVDNVNNNNNIDIT